MRPRTLGAVLALALAFLAGCGPSAPSIVPVEGIVLLNGAPLAKAKVRFLPKIENQSKYFAQGVTDADGRYTLTCQGRPGACAVENTVIVEEEEIPTEFVHDRDKREEYVQSLRNRPIPDIYRSAIGTPIRVTVTADQKEYRIELKR
jgi:hypothetical protein